MTFSSLIGSLRLWLGIERNTTSHGEKWISAIGGLLGIVSVYWVTHLLFPAGFMGTTAGVMMLASMGASAVLLFAVPHGALSQPWAVIGGHMVSACVGVSCQRLFPEHSWTPALAVGLAVGAMHYLRCIHPPGGATSLAAVIGGADIHSLGYHYLLTPVGINVAAIMLMAVAFNAFFPWRRYPAHLHRRRQSSPATRPAQRQYELTQEDFSAAMEQLNSYVDITGENLTELLELAKQHAEQSSTHPEQIQVERCYSNGMLGKAWSVRKALSLGSTPPAARFNTVRFAVVAGDQVGYIGTCSEDEFRQWARFEVRMQDNGRWVRQ